MGGERLSAPVQTGPVQRVPGSFPEVKQPGRGVDHPRATRAAVKERLEPYLYFPSGPLSLVTRRTVLYFILFYFSSKPRSYKWSFTLRFSTEILHTFSLPTSQSLPRSYRNLLTLFSTFLFCPPSDFQTLCPLPSSLTLSLSYIFCSKRQTSNSKNTRKLLTLKL